jgi:hypothetical protein
MQEVPVEANLFLNHRLFAMLLDKFGGALAIKKTMTGHRPYSSDASMANPHHYTYTYMLIIVEQKGCTEK